jgi:hypothetical protein
MEEQQGLSASGAGGNEAKMQELVEQVVQMLQQGTSPEELLQMGVPEEIIQYALQMLEQSANESGSNMDQTGAGMQQQMQQQEPAGLSQMGV